MRASLTEYQTSDRCYHRRTNCFLWKIRYLLRLQLQWKNTKVVILVPSSFRNTSYPSLLGFKANLTWIDFLVAILVQNRHFFGIGIKASFFPLILQEGSIPSAINDCHSLRWCLGRLREIKYQSKVYILAIPYPCPLHKFKVGNIFFKGNKLGKPDPHLRDRPESRSLFATKAATA